MILSHRLKGISMYASSAVCGGEKAMRPAISVAWICRVAAQMMVDNLIFHLTWGKHSIRTAAAKDAVLGGISPLTIIPYS